VVTLKHLSVDFYTTIDVPSTNKLIQIFSSKKDLMVLDSAESTATDARYSFICFDAFANFKAKNKQFYWNNQRIHLNDPFDFIQEKISEYKIEKNPELPLLQGGAVGYFGYEAAHYLEHLPLLKDKIQLPDIFLNFYSKMIAIDNLCRKGWIIATGFPEKKDSLRKEIAAQEMALIKQQIEFGEESTPRTHVQPVFSSNFTSKTYQQAVIDMKNAILNGDLFEANLSQQFQAELPHGALFRISENQALVSASPERFIKLEGQTLETFPIKGTRPRMADPVLDQQMADELLAAEKDRAENVMIVDLMRNDLSKVAEPGSVHVDELCTLKRFETVHHLVSKVSAKIKKQHSAVQVIKAAFPPGSVTGAPKIRAMEWISELEKLTRGPYCGCLGYFSFTGDMDMAVTIRTYYVNDNNIFFSAGGAVVLDSDPIEEYRETLVKTKGFIEELCS
jgi:para-aminobenzoate synthetase component 1